MRILVIEDNHDDYQILRRYINKSGLEAKGIQRVESISSACKAIEETRFDIILLDMSLPDSSGENTFLKIHDKAKDIPVIILTGLSDEKLINSTLQKGAQDFISKDEMNPDFIKHAIKRAIDRQTLLNSLDEKNRQIEMLNADLKYLIDNSIDGIIISDTTEKIVFANEAALKIMDKHMSELIGSKLDIPVFLKKPVDIEIKWKNGYIITADIRSIKIIWNGQESYLTSVRDMTERAEMEKRIRYMSFHDSLTGLYNRAYFEEEIKRIDTERQLPISIIMGDANNLKLINDVFGHFSGDEMLITLANIIRDSCRQEDLIVRIGGDEFILLLPNCDEKTAYETVKRIREKCKEIKLENGLIPSIALGHSVKNNKTETIYSIIKTAEDKMYKNKLVESKSLRNTVLASLQRTLYEKDYLTEEHAERTRELAVKFGNHLGLSEDDINDLILLTSLHDIGKIAIQKDILIKKAPLNKEEWDMIKNHPETGYRIIKEVKQINDIAEAVLAHHEQWDGNGYPNRIKGKEIPYISRILSIVDSYDVMTNDRPYRKAMTKLEAIEELKRYSGIQFDAELVEVFLEIL
jgi:diguanylate cyclase (GGDEF)-like protein